MQTKIQINPPQEEQLENAGENSSLRHQRGNGAVKKNTTGSRSSTRKKQKSLPWDLGLFFL